MPRRTRGTKNDWRQCPRCGTWFTGRPNKVFCTEFCGKIYRYENTYRFNRNYGGKPVEGITVQQVQREYTKRLPAPPPRPDNTPLCGCGVHLYTYEIPLGMCLGCKKVAIIQLREFVPTERVAA